ncbi:MAG: hypothetical protein Q4G05_04040 [Clostridia bacterium]|nr:hypothetical protein [Clostridia bacterium]
MNIYNNIGLSQNSDSERLNNRVEIMLKYYFSDIEKLTKRIEQLQCKEVENIDDDLQNQAAQRKLKSQVYLTQNNIKELEKAKEIFSNMHLRIEYDNILKTYPKMTLEEFWNRKNKVDYGDITEDESTENLNFKPIQNKRYVQNNVKNVVYKRYLKPEQYEMIFKDEKIRISILGRLDYETTFSIRDLGFYKYKIEKAKVKDEYNNFKSYNIFSGINIKRISEDEEYKRYNAKILLSDTNIKMAIEYNGGYVGEVVENSAGKFCIFHRTRKIMCSNRQ